MKNKSALPKMIGNYIAATNNSNLEEFLVNFSKDAIVSDEGKTYHGIKQIEEWRKKTTSAFKFTLELTNVEFTGGDEIVVGTNCIGNFPGSPVRLQHLFRLENKLIIALSITG